MHCHVYDHQPRKHGRTCLPVHPMTGGTRSVQSARSSNRTPLAARILSRYVALAIGLIPVVVHAQITTTIEGPPTCQSCAIEVVSTVTLGERDGPGVIGPIFRVATDGRGRYLLRYAHDPAVIKVFDDRGTFVRTIGREGYGPGEYRFIRDILPTDSSIAVLDALGRRLTLLSDSFDVLQTYPVTFDAYSIARLPSDGFVMSARMLSRDLAGAPIHFLDSKGRLVQSLFDANEVFRSDIPYSGLRIVTPTADGNAWAIPRTSYRVQQWHSERGKVREVVRQVDWFPTHQRDIQPHVDSPPPPLAKGVHIDAEGYLWVAVEVADNRWQTALYERPGREVHTVGIANQELYWDTIVEVLDPNEGEAIASIRLDGRVEHFIAGSGVRIANYREYGDGGHPVVEIRQLALSRSPHNRGGGS